MKADTIVDFERKVLLAIRFEVVPQATPSSFIRHMLWLWPEVESIYSFDTILSIADQFVGDYWEGTSDCKEVHQAAMIEYDEHNLA